jgi:hypothetical protein
MTNPIVQIGDYEIPVAGVLSVKKDSGLFGWRNYFSGNKYLGPRYAVALAGGLVLYLNEEEKKQLDHERELHEATMQVYGMLHSWQQSHGMR